METVGEEKGKCHDETCQKMRGDVRERGERNE